MRKKSQTPDSLDSLEEAEANPLAVKSQSQRSEEEHRNSDDDELKPSPPKRQKTNPVTDITLNLEEVFFYFLLSRKSVFFGR